MKLGGVNRPTTPDKRVPSAPKSDQLVLIENSGSFWPRIVIIALAYLGAALAGDTLAAPTNQASLLWPAAGLSLAALLTWGPRVWPGVWIGAFAYHFWLAAPPLNDPAIATLVATGATLQALLGARLTRHLLKAPIPLTREGDVARFLLLGGPLACLVSASVAVAAIYGSGQEMGQATTLWLQWWTGDTIGVLLFAPLMLALPVAGSVLPKSGFRIALPLLITAILLASGNSGLIRLEESQTREEATQFMDETDDSGFHILPGAISPLHGVERFFASSEKVTREEYTSFAAYIASQPGILAVDWAPRISREELSAFETTLRNDGQDNYRIFELDARGQPIPPGERSEYFPVSLTEPMPANAVALGLDHAFEAPRRNAMAHARDTGQITVTTVVPLLRTNRPAVLAFMPVYRTGFAQGEAMVAARREALRGFVVGVFSIDKLFAPLARSAEARQLHYRVTDITSGEQPSLITGNLPADAAPGWSRTISFADRTWQLEMQPNGNYWQAGSNFSSRLYLGFSVLAAFLISFASVSAAGRNAATTVEVLERTADLARELQARRDAEAEIRRLNLDLEGQVEERTRALKALHSKEEELSAIVDNLPYCLISIDTHGIVHSANPALETVLGYKPDELIGRNISMLMPEPERSQHDDHISRYLDTGEAHIINIGREVEGLHKDGRLVPLELAVNEYQIHGERFFVGSLYDISERKLFIDELTSARLDAEQASRAKSAFLAIMSHEIRTPMNGVIGMVDVLSHSRLSEYQADLITTIRESATTLLDIIDDILDFSKIEAGRMTLEHNTMRLAETVERICTSLNPDAAKKGVELSLFISPDIPEKVLSDTVRLRQVLSNLIGNAIKFSANQPDRKGHVSIRVEIAEADPLRLSFVIQDNGIGMTPDTLDKLFTPFTQADVSTTRRFGGTGLGLAISRRLVELMQGSITVSSTPGSGTTFTINLPFEAAPEQPVRAQPQLAGITCLVVENTNINTADMCTYLNDAGASVLMASDVPSAALMAAGLTAPVVAIQYVGQEEVAVDEALVSAQNLRHLLITRGRRQRARIEALDVVTLDYPLLRRQALLHAVALTAGRASRKVFHGGAVAHLPTDAEPLTIDKARAQNKLILIAEDDKLNQRVILQQLALLGYAAEVADNGMAALRLWRRDKYALLITDLYMPEMDGYTLARSIRREEGEQYRIPIIALTANTLLGEADQAKAAGMDEYLTKPVQLRLLREVLEKWLPKNESSPTECEAVQETEGGPLDVAVLQDMVGDDPATVLGLLSDYLESVRHLAEELRSASSTGDVKQVRAITHKLKSSSRLVGAQALGELCASIEKWGKEGDKAAIVHAMPEFEAALAAVEAELARLLDKKP